MHNKIAFAKTAWSELYEGGPVYGRHGYIGKYEEGHERYNFLPTPDGSYCGYLPPIGKTWAVPKPQERDGWLLIFVAAREGRGHLTVVGWYEDATFEQEYLSRPEYETNRQFETDVNGDEFVYCVSARIAHRIPVDERTVTICGEHFRRSSILYARGGLRSESWRQRLAEEAESIVQAFIPSKSPERSSAPGATPPISTPKHRSAVDIAAIKRAKQYLKQRGYKVIDRQSDKCGCDLLAKRSQTPSELHIEVKGTSLDLARFYLTKNEMSYLNNPKWRLALVTKALKSPTLRLLDEKQVRAEFTFEAVAWVALSKSSL
jgi:hypothetical protein